MREIRETELMKKYGNHLRREYQKKRPEKKVE